MSDKNDKRFNMAISKELIDRIDEYRLSTGDKFPPSKAEAIRELIREGLRAKGYEPPDEN